MLRPEAVWCCRRCRELREAWAGRPRGRRLSVGRFGGSATPDLSVLELNGQTLLDPAQSHHHLFVYTVVSRSESCDRLQLLSVIVSHELGKIAPT